jgi:hypothetical protein
MVGERLSEFRGFLTLALAETAHFIGELHDCIVDQRQFRGYRREG